MINICGMFRRNPSAKYKDTASRKLKTDVNWRTTDGRTDRQTYDPKT